MEVYCWKSCNICSCRVASEYSGFEWGKELSCVIGPLACKGRRDTLGQHWPYLTYCFISSGLICSLCQLWKQRHFDITILLQTSSQIGKIWFISYQTTASRLTAHVVIPCCQLWSFYFFLVWQLRNQILLPTWEDVWSLLLPRLARRSLLQSRGKSTAALSTRGAKGSLCALHGHSTFQFANVRELVPNLVGFGYPTLPGAFQGLPPSILLTWRRRPIEWWTRPLTKHSLQLKIHAHCWLELVWEV